MISRFCIHLGGFLRDRLIFSITIKNRSFTPFLQPEVIVPHVLGHDGKVLVQGTIWIHLVGPLKLVDRQVILTSISVSHAEVGGKEKIQGIDLNRPLHMSDGFVVTTQSGEGNTVPLVGGSVVGVDFKSPAKFSICSIPFPEAVMGAGKNRMGLGKILIQCQCSFRSLLGLGKSW